MIIEEVTLENLQCYYGSKTFEFTSGLNIVLGENGEGKTKFIEAVEWLFNGSDNNIDSLVSQKKIDEVKIGDKFSVGISITVSQHEEQKTINRFFIVEKKENSIQVSKSEYDGSIVNNKGERIDVNGSDLLNSVFPSTIRKYSIFKGEENLKIFENKDTLINLINIYSTAKSYEKYHIRGEYLKDKADDALNTELSRDIKSKRELEKIEANLREFNRQKVAQETILREKLETENDIEKSIKDIESYIHNAAELDQINDEIKALLDAKSRIAGIKDDYTTFLFDNQWILKNFDQIQTEFNSKIKESSIERNSLEVEFNIEQGKKSAQALTLSNNTLPLPLSMPSKSVMEEMLSDEICKVCNREAKKGSEAYNYMLNKLEAFIESTRPKNNEPEEILFPNNYLRKLDYLSEDLIENSLRLKNIPVEIKDRIELNENLKKKILQIEKDIEKKEEDKFKVIGKSSVGEDTLSMNLKNYTGWQGDIKRLNREIDQTRTRIESIKKEIEAENLKKDRIQQKGGGNSRKLSQIKDIFQDVSQIFTETKAKKFDEFVEDLEKRSNEKFSTINKGAFTGQINIYLKNIGIRPQAEIELLDENGKTFIPGKSLETSMNISILMAISDLTKETQDENYPFLMDAPVSSFGENKKTELLNELYKVSNQQTLIFLKDYLKYDENGKLFVMPEFDEVSKNKALWIKLKRPFDPKKIETLETIIEKI
jgi:DNA sulfur modification protein DndD